MAEPAQSPFRAFETERLSVAEWSPLLADPATRRDLEAALEPLLTPRVLEHLPDPLALVPGPSAISDWIDDRAGEADVYAVRLKPQGALIGLLIAAGGDGHGALPQIHIGYLFAENAWGRGFATEMLIGLAPTRPARLFAGVARDNAGSMRVLEKAGFTLSDRHSTGDTAMFTRAVR